MCHITKHCAILYDVYSVRLHQAPGIHGKKTRWWRRRRRRQLLQTTLDKQLTIRGMIVYGVYTDYKLTTYINFNPVNSQVINEKTYNHKLKWNSKMEEARVERKNRGRYQLCQHTNEHTDTLIHTDKRIQTHSFIRTNTHTDANKQLYPSWRM